MDIKAPTIRDVAQRAGVSTSLVSLVINNRPKVSPHREARVRAAMSELGYVPPPPSRRRGPRLNSRRPTHRIAMVMTSIDTVLLQAPVYTDILHAVADATAGIGKSLTIHHLMGSESTPETSTALRASDGAIIFGRPLRGPLWRELQSRPCVRVMGLVDQVGFWDHVTYNNAAIGRLAGEYVLELGCKTAAFLGPTVMSESLDLMTSERGEQFRLVLENNGVRVLSSGNERFITRTANRDTVNAAKLSEMLDQLLANAHKPEAIFVPGDQLASALHSMLLARGIRPGIDVHIVSVNNERILLDHLTPRPATIDIHATKIGQAAVDLLSRRIADPTLPRSILVMQPTLVRGDESEPAANEASASSPA